MTGGAECVGPTTAIRRRRGGELCLALVVTGIPALVWRAFVERREGPGGLVVAFLVLGAAAVAFGGLHRRNLGLLGVAGTAIMATGAMLAAWAVDVDRGAGADVGDAVWRAHFLIMVGSLVVAAGAAGSGRLSRPLAVGGFVTSWAFLGAWGVGLAWLAWGLAVARGHAPARSGDTSS